MSQAEMICRQLIAKGKWTPSACSICGKRKKDECKLKPQTKGNNNG